MVLLFSTYGLYLSVSPSVSFRSLLFPLYSPSSLYYLRASNALASLICPPLSLPFGLILRIISFCMSWCSLCHTQSCIMSCYSTSTIRPSFCRVSSLASHIGSSPLRIQSILMNPKAAHCLNSLIYCCGTPWCCRSVLFILRSLHC
eukprot:414361_1